MRSAEYCGNVRLNFPTKLILLFIWAVLIGFIGFSVALANVYNTMQAPVACSSEDSSTCGYGEHQLHRDLVAVTPCQNSDFKPFRQTAVVTLNTGPSKYLQAYINGTIVLGLSVKKHSKIDVDLLLLEINNKPLPDAVWPLLAHVGWKRCVVRKIEPPRKPHRNFADQFTKLHMWGLSPYKSVVYMDSDTFAVGPIDNLLTMDLEGKRIGASRDFRAMKWTKGFNLGVCKIQPNATEYNRLLELVRSDAVEYENVMSEQGWLNVVYKDQWKDIGFWNNANMAALSKTNESREDLNVIHLTSPKPWKCNSPHHETIQRYCKMWNDYL
jgi:Glycosyl transferase family 8